MNGEWGTEPRLDRHSRFTIHDSRFTIHDSYLYG
jgi:hypothetical protein